MRVRLYRLRMQRRLGPLSWVWLAVTAATLIVGLVVMHHLPPGADRPSHHGTTTAADHRMSADVGEAAEQSCPCGADHLESSPTRHPGGHTDLEHLLMHLCLAILAAGVLLIGALALSRRRRSFGHLLPVLPGSGASFHWIPPPNLTGRRLAQLCVLRL